MKAKEYFREIAKLESMIRAKTSRAEILRSMAYGVSSPVITDMPKGKSKHKSPMAETIAKLVDLENEIAGDKARLESRKLEALELIGKLSSMSEQTVLYQRYFEKKSWNEIRVDMYYSESGIHKLHGSALQKIECLLKSRAK